MAPSAFWSDLHEEESIYRSRPPRIAKVRAIEATARLLRPTKASMARTTEKKHTGKRRMTDDMDKENNGVNHHSNNRNNSNNNGRRAPPSRKRRLTIPQSPKFHTHAKKKTREQLLTMTSRELREIEAIRKKVQETRKRNQKYHEDTTRSLFSYAPTNGTSEKQTFTMALESCGGLGVPAVRRQKLTTPVGFTFESDKRAASRKRKSASSSSLAPVAPKRFRL